MRDGTHALHEGIKSDSCPLCRVYLDGVEHGSTCKGCPIMKSTGKQFCRGTPYHEASAAFHDKVYFDWPKAAQAEIDFLESLIVKE